MEEGLVPIGPDRQITTHFANETFFIDQSTIRKYEGLPKITYNPQISCYVQKMYLAKSCYFYLNI